MPDIKVLGKGGSGMCAFMFNSWCPNFAGIDTFHNIPFQAGLEGMDYAVMGIPYDCGSVMRADARLGPGSVRLESFDKNQLGWSTDCQVYGGSDFLVLIMVRFRLSLVTWNRPCASSKSLLLIL